MCKQSIGRGIEALTGRHKSNLLVIHDLKNSKLIEVLAMKFLVNINHSNLALSSNWSRRPAFHAGNPGSSPGRVTRDFILGLFIVSCSFNCENA